MEASGMEKCDSICCVVVEKRPKIASLVGGSKLGSFTGIFSHAVWIWNFWNFPEAYAISGSSPAVRSLVRRL